MTRTRFRPEVPVVLFGAALVIALGAVAATVEFNALIVAALAVVFPVALWLLGDLRRTLFLFVAVIALMPRFASPVSIGFKPTFLDVAMLGLLAAWVMRQLGPRRSDESRTEAPATPAITVPLLLLVVVAIATFVVGIPNGALTTLVIRRFAEMVISLLLVLVLTDILRDDAMQVRFVRFTLILGGLSAAAGIVLYLIPDALAMQALSALRVFDYPTGPEVLRYVRDDPELLQRATGLWIDPNAFGGYLLMTGAVCLPQVFTTKPVLPRGLATVCVGLIGLCLVLTVSRGAMVGFALAGALIGVLRYRRLLLIGVLVIGAALLLPQTRELVSHFIDGFLGQDLATQMRFGEYKDAFRLIERYPLLGVGFTGSPDVDLYVGVSSMYLLIMQQMGILGITAFVMLMLALGISAVRAWPLVRQDEARTAIFLGAHGALAGALFSGIFDHYFFNIDFHNSVLWLCACLALAAASQAAGRVAGQASEQATEQATGLAASLLYSKA